LIHFDNNIEKYRKYRTFFKTQEFTGQDKNTGNTGHSRSPDPTTQSFLQAGCPYCRPKKKKENIHNVIQQW